MQISDERAKRLADLLWQCDERLEFFHDTAHTSMDDYRETKKVLTELKSAIQGEIDMTADGTPILSAEGGKEETE